MPVFSNSNLELTYNPPETNSPPPELSNVSCSNDEVLHLLSSIPRKTSSGPDGISSAMLWNTATTIAPSLTKLFNRSLSLGQVPADWKLSNITPVPKVVTPNLFQIIAPYSCYHCHQKFFNVLSTTGFYLIYLLTPFSQTLSSASVLVAPPRRHSLLPQPAGINIWMRSRVLQLSSSILQKLLIWFPTQVSSELLLKLVSPARCTLGLHTVCCP